MKTANALTLTLSHPMGEGTSAERFSFHRVIQPASTHGSPKSWVRFSLSLSERERAGVRVS
jgi:hypothetical protein